MGKKKKLRHRHILQNVQKSKFKKKERNVRAKQNEEKKKTNNELYCFDVIN